PCSRRWRCSTGLPSKPSFTRCRADLWRRRWNWRCIRDRAFIRTTARHSDACARCANARLRDRLRQAWLAGVSVQADEQDTVYSGRVELSNNGPTDHTRLVATLATRNDRRADGLAVRRVGD